MELNKKTISNVTNVMSKWEYNIVDDEFLRAANKYNSTGYCYNSEIDYSDTDGYSGYR